MIFGAKIYDSLSNLLTGLGLPGIDKSTASTFEDVRLTFAELENAYSADWLASKVVDLPPYDMTREWRQMTGNMDPDKMEKFKEFCKKINYREKVKEGMQWGRLYGGGAILMNVDDGGDPSEPLQMESIKKGGLRFLIVSDSQFLHVGQVNNSPLEQNYGFPETYRLAQSNLQIHHTRVIRFEGKALPLQGRRRNRFWGKSIIESLHSPIVRAGEVQQSVGTLVHEATVDVIKIPELMEMLSDAETEEQLKNRFATAKIQKSINRMMLMDSEEEFEQHSQTFAGLVEIIEKYISIVGGAADIPITRLMGSSPGGLSSTGESDLRNYYDMLSARQETDLRPRMEYMDEIIYRSLFGEEPKDGELDFEFNPLWQMTEKEEAELQSSRSERDSKYLANLVINEAIVARDLMEKNVYSGVDEEYVKELEKVLSLQEENFDEENGGEE